MVHLRTLGAWALAAFGVFTSLLLTGVTPAQVQRQSAQDWPFGPYQVVENWPKPLPDKLHSHDSWTWGSMGSVYAETPDRIWIAQRGELPLPQGAKPWTPYAALDPTRGNSNSNTDGVTATCQ